MRGTVLTATILSARHAVVQCPEAVLAAQEHAAEVTMA